mmetsp:Transcript_23413/g.23370  ORF Transcript_23413/g.23370 Transcript_23413/m.23370 type:complete len:286 (+) Transcript_23413:75-932(+)|eukprot:CAMPEP_0196995238 /NCGR_PEP_ID=MMETSP1380-20130617/1393_1 /TAXON_ID=5936 /ORGANISM="Euplotes crassus, Strain CT5" /LENGTH=285 /DNA_ID=CAMNT_0042410859 /DNA_START=70 /DNA_END=927 /DNA_ORIENTATION=-
MTTVFETMDRPRAGSVNSPPSLLCNTTNYQEDMVSSDSTRSRSEASYLYEYNSKTLLKKAQSIKKSGIFWHDSSIMKSQDIQESSDIGTTILRNRAKSTALPDNSAQASLVPKKVVQPKVMKYVQKTSNLFDPLEKVAVSFALPESIVFYKGVHELDGQTYILKKIRIFLKDDEDIKDHPAYQEILMVKDNSSNADIRYVNSWVELEKEILCEDSGENDGLFVQICIQMRYINSSIKLVKDLLLWSDSCGKSCDEDTLFDMAEDICDQIDLTKNDDFEKICAKYG